MGARVKRPIPWVVGVGVGIGTGTVVYGAIDKSMGVHPAIGVAVVLVYTAAIVFVIALVSSRLERWRNKS